MRTDDVKSVLHKTTFRNKFTITFTLKPKQLMRFLLSEIEKTLDVLFASMCADTLFHRATEWQKLLEI